MKTSISGRQAKSGFAMLTILLVLAALTSMLGMLIHLSGQRAHMAKKLTDRIKAKAYAEAGVDYAYSRLSQDFSLRYDESVFKHAGSTSGGSVMSSSGLSTNSSVSPTTIGEGSYDITLRIINSNSVLVTSVGTCNASQSEAQAVVEDFYAGAAPEDVNNLEGFEYAMLSGGSFDFGGSATVSNSTGAASVKLHSNNPIDIRGDASADGGLMITSSVEIEIGNNHTIDGSIMAENLAYTPSKVTITGSATEAMVPPIKVPDIDLTPYYNYASDNGAVVSGPLQISSDYTPPGGILWVEGDVEISGNTVINGSIIATGDIKMSGSASVNPTVTSFALASRDGDIKVTSSGTIEGLIYTKTGNFEQAGNGEIIGQVLISGTIKKAGNSTLNLTYQQSIPTPPGDYGTKSLIGISAWQR